MLGGEPTIFVLLSYEENVARVTLSLPRLWTTHAGKRVGFGAP